MKALIKKISDSFLKEAMNSPQLLEDMAAMEKYLSESYSNRIFIELLQNADDCGSKKIIFMRDGDDLVFANNGRPFDEKDIIAICRSGASSKKRGESIGFRGVGFKSTTYLSDEIVILSNNVSFSFSKLFCAKALNKEIEKVPTARIPFLVDYSPSSSVNKLIKDGFTTVFIFKNAKLNEFASEFEEINDGYFLFLHNIENCSVNIDKTHYECILSRIPHQLGELVQNLKSKRTWLNISQDKVTISFLYEDGVIQECQQSEALYHCYLPTFDYSPYPIKINYDFSTDPSRKHITLDTISDNATTSIARLIANILTKALNGNNNQLFRNIFSLFKTPSSFTSLNLDLQRKIEIEIKNSVKLSLLNGNIISILEYKILPDWLEDSEKQYIREHSKFVQEHTLPIDMFRQIVNLEIFLSEYSEAEYSLEDWISILEDSDFVDSITNDTYTVIFCNLLEKANLERTINNKEINYSSIIIKTEQGLKTISEISQNKKILVEEDLKEKITSEVSSSLILSFCEEMNLDQKQICDSNSLEDNDIKDKREGLFNEEEGEDSDTDIDQDFTEKNNNDERGINSTYLKVKPKLHRWKSIENQCVEFEEYLGNEAINVSEQNLGYDIESMTPDGEKRYIEVKSISDGMTSFSLTNNEYSSAAHLGKQYYICLISLTDDSCKIVYIQDPAHSLNLRKRVKAWEWFCDEYEGEEFSFKNI